MSNSSTSKRTSPCLLCKTSWVLLFLGRSTGKNKAPSTRPDLSSEWSLLVFSACWAQLETARGWMSSSGWSVCTCTQQVHVCAYLEDFIVGQVCIDGLSVFESAPAADVLKNFAVFTEPAVCCVLLYLLACEILTLFRLEVALAR